MDKVYFIYKSYLTNTNTIKEIKIRSFLKSKEFKQSNYEADN